MINETSSILAWTLITTGLGVQYGMEVALLGGGGLIVLLSILYNIGDHER